MSRLQSARRELDRLEWEHARALRTEDVARAFGLEPKIRDAQWAVDDLDTAERNGAVRAARRTAALLDVVLALVAVLVMAFSLGNIREFAAGHGVIEPLPWLLAPMVDLALVATLSADAFLSRNGADGGGWAAALRWFAGLGTLLLNAWDAVVKGAPGDVIVHAVPPLLLVLLAEAAPHYRRGAAAVVDRVRIAAQRQAADAPEDVRTDAPASTSVRTPDALPTAADDPAHGPVVDTAAAPAQPATAPADDTAPAPRPKARTTPAAPRPRQTPGAARNARPMRTEDELLTHLQELRTGADGSLSQRAVLASLGIGAPRLRALLDAHGLTLDPLPTPRPLHLVDEDLKEGLRA
ncbi:MAG: hypothetical protein JWO98_4070 [Frankiales bacterium]|nr:hypothetical protein [Frankiales bacterium]